jgi:hypothetical protein
MFIVGAALGVALAPHCMVEQRLHLHAFLLLSVVFHVSGVRCIH